MNTENTENIFDIKDSVEMTEAAKRARREYHRNWAKANRDKIRRNNARYWKRKAEKQSAGNEG